MTSHAGPDLPLAALLELRERYDFDREISAGMMARVFRATDRRLGRLVALKVLRPEIALSVGRDRFLDEIRIAASLQHPNIMPVYDSGSPAGLLYFTMPFIEGESLRERLERDHALESAEVVRLARAVAEALEHAHARGIVHRDVKPENVMLDGGVVLLSDFGVARLMRPNEGGRRTSVGLAVGTPGYMSPEQAVGQRDLDGRSDIYSLACVIYEMLSGDPPFTGPSPQAVIAQHIADSPAPLIVQGHRVPPRVDVVLQRALAKDPQERFASAREFVTELERALALPTRTVITPAGIRLPVRIPPARIAMSAMAVLAVIATIMLLARRAPLDPNRVALFPLTGDSGGRGGTTTYLGYLLEGTQPLRWENGDEWIKAAGGGAETAEELGELARKHGAAWFFDGQVAHQGDSVAVVMRLYDVVGDSMLARRGRSGPATTPIAQLAAGALADLLPQLVSPGSAIDVAGLRDQLPSTVANLLQGDRAYRASRFSEAYDFFVRAGGDSGFPLADLRAAEAAVWLDHHDVAESLAVRAGAREDRLPARYRPFARGMSAWLRGDADSALHQAEVAIAGDSTWAEAWMLLGEVYTHLLPDAAPLDSLAESAFRAARTADAGFSPPFYHLAETAIRRGSVRDAQLLADSLEALHADAGLRRPLALMLRCAGGRMTDADWSAELPAGSIDVLEAAKTLSTSASYRDCGAAGFRAVAEWDSTPIAQRFGAFQGLHGILVRGGHREEVIALLDSERGRAASAHYLYVVDAAAGLGFEQEAAAVVTEIEARPGPMSNNAAWLLAAWHASRGDSARVRALADTLRARGALSGDARTQLQARAAAAYAALAAADTSRAISLLSALRPVGRQRELAWTAWDALGLERLVLARLLLARGDPAAALHAASVFDAPSPVMYLVYQADALRLRADAADALSQRRLARRFRDRLASFTAVPPASPASAGRT